MTWKAAQLSPRKFDWFQGLRRRSALEMRGVVVRWGKASLTLLSKIESSVNARHRKTNLESCRWLTKQTSLKMCCLQPPYKNVRSKWSIAFLQSLQSTVKGWKERCTWRMPHPCSLRTTALGPATPTFALTSDQFFSSWNPGPNFTVRMQTGPSI